MSTTVPTHHDRTFDVSGTPRVPFPRLVQVEMRKMGDTRAGAWLLALTVVVVVIAIVAVAWSNRDGGAPFLAYLLSTLVPLNFLLPVLGVLRVTGEWGQRTTLTTFALEPSRMRIMAAKIAAGLLYALIGTVIAVAVASLATLALGSDDAWADATTALFVNLVVMLVIVVLQGIGFGALLRSSPGAIVSLFALPIVFTIVLSFAPGFADNQGWVDLSVAQTALMDNTSPSGEEWARIATSSTLWMLAPLVLGLIRIRRMEIK